MPISHSEHSSLTCPSCGQEFTAEVWLIVDAGERPELVQALQAGQLNEVTCPHCGVSGPAGAPLLYHNALSRRVLFAAPLGAPDYQLREASRELLTLLMSNIPEDQYQPYLNDVQFTQGLDGVQIALEKDARRTKRQGTAAGQGIPSPMVKVQHLPPPAPTALPATPDADQLPPLLLGVQELLSANAAGEVERVLAEYPELLAHDADQTLAHMAEIALVQREHDVAEALGQARKLLAELRVESEATGQAAPIAQHLSPVSRLSDDAYNALMQVSSEQELIEMTRAHPALLEPWSDIALASRVESLLDLGDERGAQVIEDRREALAGLRGSMVADTSVVDAVGILLAADDQDDIAAVLDAHPVLLSEAAQEVLWSLASEARSRGDDDTATAAIEYRALLREVRKGLDEG